MHKHTNPQSPAGESRVKEEEEEEAERVCFCPEEVVQYLCRSISPKTTSLMNGRAIDLHTEKKKERERERTTKTRPPGKILLYGEILHQLEKEGRDDALLLI